MAPPSTPFALQTSFPPVIFTYCTKTDGGRGEQRMWRIKTFESAKSKGDKYVGQYKDGKRHGIGKYTFAGGRVHLDGRPFIDGEWEDGNPKGQCALQ